MNQRTTRLAFTSPERKLGGAMLLLVGMLGVVGCEGKKVAPISSSPQLEILSCESYDFDSAKVLAYTFHPKNLKQVQFKLSFVESGIERVVGSWTVEPHQKTAQIQLAIFQQGDKTEVTCHATDSNTFSSASSFVMPANLEGGAAGFTGHSQTVSTSTNAIVHEEALQLHDRNIFWGTVSFPKGKSPASFTAACMGTLWTDLIQTSKKQTDSRLVLTAEIPPEVTPPAPKN